VRFVQIIVSLITLPCLASLAMAHNSLHPEVDDSTPFLSTDLLSELDVYGNSPESRQFISSESWSGAKVKSTVELIRGLLSSRVVLEDDETHQESTDWWDSSLQDDPVIVANAWMQLDMYFNVWNTTAWPEEFDTDLVEKYRWQTISLLVDVDHKLGLYIQSLEQDVANQVPVNIWPPEGLPSRTHPSLVSDPVARKDYELRLQKANDQELMTEKLNMSLGVLSEFRIRMMFNFQLLFQDMDDASFDQFSEELINSSKIESVLWSSFLAHREGVQD
jgi:hypothetical protein